MCALVDTKSLFVDESARLRGVVWFRIELFALSVIVVAPNFCRWIIRALVLLSCIVQHIFLDDHLQLRKLFLGEIETLHDILLVVFGRQLRAYHGINPWHLLAGRKSLFCRRSRWSICDVRMVQSSLLILDDDDQITVAVLANHFEIHALFHACVSCALSFEHESGFKSF